MKPSLLMFKKKDFNIIDRINDGPFWETFVVKTTGLGGNMKKVFFETRVMKKSKMVQLEEEQNVIKELRERIVLRHLFLCNIIDRFQDYDSCFLVSDLPCGGFLYFYLNKHGFFNKSTSVFFSAQIISGIQYLHKQGFLYRFLAPETIMITGKGNIKLRFDFMNQIGLTEKKYKDNIRYIPIEHIKDKPVNGASDYWSIGIIIYEMLFGRTPFEGDDVENLLNRLLDKFDFRRMGVVKKDRIRIKKHPFFDSIDWNELEKGNIPSPLKIQNVNIFNKIGKKMSDSFRADFKEGQVDGYGNIFDSFGINLDFTHIKDC